MKSFSCLFLCSALIVLIVKSVYILGHRQELLYFLSRFSPLYRSFEHVVYGSVSYSDAEIFDLFISC